MPTSISLDNFSSAGLHYKRSPILPNALTNFVTSAQQQPHDSHYSNVNTSPYSKLKFQQEEATIQESLEYEAGDDMSKPASSTAHSTTHMASNNTTRTNDDSVSFYSTPLNATKNDSASSKASSPSSTAETHGDKHSSLSSLSMSPCSKNENSNGESQILVTASEGETSFELDPAIENTITNVAIEISYGKELETLITSNDAQPHAPFSIKQCLEEKEAMYSKYSANEILSENISPRTSISNDESDTQAWVMPNRLIQHVCQCIRIVIMPNSSVENRLLRFYVTLSENLKKKSKRRFQFKTILILFYSILKCKYRKMHVCK